MGSYGVKYVVGESIPSLKMASKPKCSAEQILVKNSVNGLINDGCNESDAY